jgi:predicted homoserine dehydrogenase-like protein
MGPEMGLNALDMRKYLVLLGIENDFTVVQSLA